MQIHFFGFFCLGLPFIALPTYALPLCPRLGWCLTAPISRSPVQSCARALTSTFSRGSPADPRRCSGLHRPQTEAEVLEQSAQTLRAHLAALLSALSRSVRACPAVIRATFRQLFRRVRERFPSAQHEVRPLPVGAGGGREGRKLWGRGHRGGGG